MCSAHRILGQFFYPLPLHAGALGSDELPKQPLEALHVLLHLVSDPGRRGHHQLVQLRAQTDLGVLLGEIFELHAGRSLHTRPLKQSDQIYLDTMTQERRCTLKYSTSN